MEKMQQKYWHDVFGNRMDSTRDANKKVSNNMALHLQLMIIHLYQWIIFIFSPEFGYIRVEGLADDTDKAYYWLFKSAIFRIYTVTRRI